MEKATNPEAPNMTQTEIKEAIAAINVKYHHGGRGEQGARDAALEKIAVARKALEAVAAELNRLESMATAKPHDWGFAGSASHVAIGLAQILPDDE